MLIGYARVPTHDQNLDLQKDALKKALCEKLFVDVASGNHGGRSGLEQARALLRKGDVLVVCGDPEWKSQTRSRPDTWCDRHVSVVG